MIREILGNDMMYYTFDDFMRNRKYIKDKLMKQDKEYFAIYHLYVESRPWVKDYYRGVIWDYLNNYLNESDLQYEYDKYLMKYGDKNEQQLS